MLRSLFLPLALLALSTLSPQPAAGQSSQGNLLQNPAGRDATSLDGPWRAIVDPYENGYYNYRYEPHENGYFKDAKPTSPSDLVEYDFDASPTLQVPGDWNSQRPELLLYEGTVWYRRLFEVEADSKPEPERRLFVHFGAANYEARAWLNGEELGHHVGGFTPFAFEVTEHVRKGSNSLVVKVDDTRRRRDSTTSRCPSPDRTTATSPATAWASARSRREATTSC